MKALKSFDALIEAVRAAMIKEKRAATQHELELVRSAGDEAEGAWIGKRQLASYRLPGEPVDPSLERYSKPPPLPSWGELYAELSVAPKVSAQGRAGAPAHEYPSGAVREVVRL